MDAAYTAKTPITFTAHGQEKTRWHVIGKAYTRADGSIMVCLDSVPLNGGYIYLFKPDDKPAAPGR